jgi:hypothetical protein
MTTTTPHRYVSRARYSASDRPVPPDLDVVAEIEARPAKRVWPREPGALERALRSELGRLERSMARERRRVLAARAERAAKGESVGAPNVRFSRDTLERHRALVQAIRRLEGPTYDFSE